MRVMTVIGTRPEATKLAPVIKELDQHSESVESVVCSTGQHREMLDQMLALFNIRPNIELDVMQEAQTPAQVAARILQKFEFVLADVNPDWVLVQGDTTTVMAAALAAAYKRKRVAHVEAGLRTYDRNNPFPEEMNRVLADHVSDLHFAPTESAKRNLLREGISKESIFVTGNTAVDSLLDVAARPQPPGIKALGLPPDRKMILVTAHRRENHGRPIRDICAALRVLAKRPDVYIVYAVHRNPQIWEPVHAELSNVANISLIAPQDYLTMVHLMKRSKLILTDSGGIQEEAPTLGVPVLVLRKTTERPEAVEAGTARLVGTDQAAIIREATTLLDDGAAYTKMSTGYNPFGDGQAAKRIVKILRQHTGLN